jgi:hypothetical protein
MISILRAAILVATLTLAVAACGGTPALPELTDPTEILQAAAENAASADSVHLDFRADGELKVATGPATTSIALDGTTANADLDLAGGDARVTFASPGLLNLRGELLLVDGTAYAKTSMTGADYLSFPMGSTPGSGAGATPGTSPDTTSLIAALADLLATPGLEPTKGEDASCGSATCYTVTIELTADELAALGLGDAASGIDLPIPSDLPVPLPDLSGIAGVDVTALVEKDTRRLAEVTLEAQAAETATATLDLRFSKWDEPVNVSAPPTDEVGGGLGG